MSSHIAISIARQEEVEEEEHTLASSFRSGFTPSGRLSLGGMLAKRSGTPKNRRKRIIGSPLRSSPDTVHSQTREPSGPLQTRLSANVGTFDKQHAGASSLQASHASSSLLSAALQCPPHYEPAFQLEVW
jgi:hypothetical protein